MKLVVDTDILIAGLIRDSTTRRILLLPRFTFYAPAHALAEVKTHLPIIQSKSGLSKGQITLTLNALRERVETVSETQFAAKLMEASKAMRGIDKKDAPFLALALSFRNDGIWSDDRHFRRQTLVKVWTTRELVVQLRKRL